MKDLILSVKDVDEKIKNTPLFYIDTDVDIWGEEVSWEYLETELKLSRFLLLDLKTWLNSYTERYPIQFEIRGLELLLKLRKELRDKHKVHYYSDLFQDYLLDESYE